MLIIWPEAWKMKQTLKAAKSCHVKTEPKNHVKTERHPVSPDPGVWRSRWQVCGESTNLSLIVGRIIWSCNMYIAKDEFIYLAPLPVSQLGDVSRLYWSDSEEWMRIPSGQNSQRSERSESLWGCLLMQVRGSCLWWQPERDEWEEGPKVKIIVVDFY